MEGHALTSRERMALTMEYKPTDYTPCSFMLFFTLQDRVGHDWRKFADAQTELGLDTAVMLPDVPGAMHADVKITEWKEPASAYGYPVLHKKYETPAGIIKAEVKQTEDWEDGDHIEFGSDFTVPRSIKQHVCERADLKSLRYLLCAPSAAQLQAFREECSQVRAFAQKRGLLLETSMGAGSVVDAAIRIAGVEPLIFAAIEDPGYLEEFLTILWDRNMLNMEIMLDEKPDLYIRRGWYENMSFWSPGMFRRFISPQIEKEVRWAREAGVKYGYINTCSYMQILDDIVDLGVDVLIGADPVEDKSLDMALLKARTKGKVCLWGGGNGFVTVENGAPEQIRGEVAAAFETLAPGGGFILSPIDNVRELSERAMQNSLIFIDAWKEKRYGPFNAGSGGSFNAGAGI